MSAQGERTQREGGKRARWSSDRPRQAAAVYVVAYLLVAAGGAMLVVRAVSSVALAAVLATAVAAIALGLSLLLVLSLCRVPMGARAEVGWMLGMMAAFCMVRPMVFAIVGKWVGEPEAGKRLAAALPVLPHQGLLGNAVLIVWAAFLGRLVSRVIREGKLLLPAAAVASVADVITVFWGPVAKVTEAAPEVAETFSAWAPVAAPPEVVAPILSAVGIGDFMFLALFFAVALRHSMRAATAMWATFGVMLVAPAAFIIWPQAVGIPGVPFISAAVLWVNRRHFDFTREEKRALAFAGALVATAAVAAWVMLGR